MNRHSNSGYIKKEDLYTGVKQLVNGEEKTLHFQLTQQKLYTLFSIGFQYLLYNSTKEPGSYIIRIEDAHLSDKILRNAKDSSTRSFMQRLSLPRKLKYNSSTFFLDFFVPQTWGLTNQIPHDKIKGALIVTGTGSKPMQIEMENEEDEQIVQELPENYYINALKLLSKRLVLIDSNNEFDELETMEFSFIKKANDTLSGVTIREDLEFSDKEKQ